MARCGFNRNTHRAILYGPMEYGGASFRHLYVQQGLGQVSEFIRNWRLKSTAGLLIRIALAWFQEQVGVSFPILCNVKAALPQLESKWIASLRDFLGEYDMHLTVQETAIPKLHSSSKPIRSRTSLTQPVHAWTEANFSATHRYTVVRASAIVFIRNARPKKNGNTVKKRPCSGVMRRGICTTSESGIL